MVTSPYADALRVTQSTGRLRDQRWVLTLLRAVRRSVVEIRYRSPWKEEASTHQFEPWQLWLHDGVLYVRGRRSRGAMGSDPLGPCSEGAGRAQGALGASAGGSTS
ncbi:WYL domain-containing protein [Sorangium sp. So ce375]|uniref:WYL domain-containing protein n=1 Tax=Sorangium sp. So ce375 TaxID=3133306 RepID=UPI003F5C0705